MSNNVTGKAGIAAYYLLCPPSPSLSPSFPVLSPHCPSTLSPFSLFLIRSLVSLPPPAYVSLPCSDPSSILPPYIIPAALELIL